MAMHRPSTKDEEERNNLLRMYFLMLKEGYKSVRMVPDGTFAGIMQMNYTWRAFVKLDEYGNSGGVDFAKQEEAKDFVNSLKKWDDPPTGNWLADKRTCAAAEHPPEEEDDFLYGKETRTT